MNSGKALKLQARSMLIGKYSMFFMSLLMYFVCNLIAGAIPAAVFQGADIPVFNVVLRIVLSFMLLTLVNLVRVGFFRAVFCTCFEQDYAYRDIFFAFGDCRDQFLKIEMLISGIQSVISLIMMVFEHLSEKYSLDIWEYYGLYIVFSAVVVVLTLAATLRFSFAVYVVMEQPGISALAAIKASVALTRGVYFKYLFFRLSFAGYYILGYFSFMIGFLFVRPYIEVSSCLFYKSLR